MFSAKSVIVALRHLSLTSDKSADLGLADLELQLEPISRVGRVVLLDALAPDSEQSRSPRNSAKQRTLACRTACRRWSL